MRLLFSLFLPFFLLSAVSARQNPETEVIDLLVKSKLFQKDTDKTCSVEDRYLVYLIDNFDQQVAVVEELQISHGGLMKAILVSGRNDIEVRTLNTSLTRGLATVLLHLNNGGCADAVISSIPGSNYSYEQISSFLPGGKSVDETNILARREALYRLMREIATGGFPSVEWLNQLDGNPVKLREDARKLVLLDCLGRCNVPVYLPYGNGDSRYRGKRKMVNLLGLSRHARLFSGVNDSGGNVSAFPDSPLSSGYGRAVYAIVECPDHTDAGRMKIDVNEDGVADFSYRKRTPVPFYRDGELAYSPPPLPPEQFALFKARAAAENSLPRESVVMRRDQYLQLASWCSDCPEGDMGDLPLVWLRPGENPAVLFFTPQCQRLGTISGTSLIPPSKIKEILPRGGHSRGAAAGKS